MRIGREGRALLSQYAEDLALVIKEADDSGDEFDRAISEAQLDLVLHLIAIFEVVD